MFSPEAREADADDHLLLFSLRRRVGCVRLVRLQRWDCCAARRSGDSVMDEAALKWSDLAHESSGGRVVRALREARDRDANASSSALFIEPKSGALPSQRTAGSPNAALISIHTILDAPCTKAACARLVPQLQPSPAKVLSHR